jgi:hypothetical protein
MFGMNDDVITLFKNNSTERLSTNQMLQLLTVSGSLIHQAEVRHSLTAALCTTNNTEHKNKDTKVATFQTNTYCLLIMNSPGSDPSFTNSSVFR